MSSEADFSKAQGQGLADAELPLEAGEADFDDNPPRSFSPWSDQSDTGDDTTGISADDSHTSASLLDKHCHSVELVLGQMLDLGGLIRRSGHVSRLSRADASFTNGCHLHLSRHLQLILRRRNIESDPGFFQGWSGLCRSSQEFIQVLGHEDTHTGRNSVDHIGNQLRTEQLQIIRANLIRRHRFKFFRKRAARLRKPEILGSTEVATETSSREPRLNASANTLSFERTPYPEGDTPTTPPTTSLGQGSASTADPVVLTLNEQRESALPIVESYDYAPSSELTNTGMKLSYPKPPPRLFPGQAAFSCPCCHQPFSYSKADSKKSWQ